MRPFVFLAALVLVSGCGGRRGEEATASFEGRLDAAKAITNSTNRDSALSSLALESAKAGEGNIAKQCVASISHSTVKDSAAYSAAIALVRAGKSDEAKAVADLISNSTQKDKAMAKIAAGG